ncbi:AAA family ATPase [Moraxella sp. PS-22]|uniref:AAA family ATPase n=2 Tax=Moraxella tetraodonis TaxID=2767221 RepID=A0A9X1USL6_9GAMM|nr:AAA family ATPase [Moraxella tetraodonis]MCG8148343.1 AAA family ATPase [Moraxella tetraodonis]
MLVSINEIVLDKPEVVKLAVACLLANGHLLLQDLPGMGKTTLAHAIANHLGLSFNRVQFTSDMLPADILGISLYKTDTGTFEFKPGPIFCQLLLADEINRSSPKTQSALLEAMEERQVSQDGVTRKLPEPFFVIATQNPTQQSGVFILPESQLDRFLMCLSLGYPSVNAERELLLGKDRRQMLSQITPMLDTQSLQQAQSQAKDIYIADVVIDYLQRLVAKTRESRDYHGLSTRGVLALKQAAQAFAYLGGYNEVTPEDIQAVFAAVVDHRLGQAFIPFNHLGGEQPQSIATQLLRQVPVLV